MRAMKQPKRMTSGKMLLFGGAATFAYTSMITIKTMQAHAAKTVSALSLPSNGFWIGNLRKELLQLFELASDDLQV